MSEQEPLHSWILATMPHALAYATSLVHNQDVAEDLTHDCYCRLLQKADAYDLPRDGLKILLRAITNAVIDYQRRQRPLLSLEIDDSKNGFVTTEVGNRQMEQPVAWAMRRELEEAIEAGLGQLPLLERAALQMKSLGCSLDEIAEALVISANHAGVLIYRARQNLSQFLAPYLEDTAR